MFKFLANILNITTKYKCAEYNNNGKAKSINLANYYASMIYTTILFAFFP